MEKTLPAANRALTAGLSAGAGLALTAAAFAATIPFDEVHDVVRVGALPFAVGALAGVGINAAGIAIADHRAAVRAEREAEGGASAEASHLGGFMRNRDATPKGVPVIARAQDALSEADAWADIDALMSDESPVSCDPARSKDIYEIALEEMARANEHAADVTAASPAQPGTPVSARTAPIVSPDITATSAFVLSQVNAAQMASAQVTAPSASGIIGFRPRAAASPAAPVTVGQQAAQTVSASAALDDTNVLTPIDGGALQPTGSGAAVTASVPAEFLAPEEPVETVVEVPVADYSGHEDMWAAALAILEGRDDEVVLPVEEAPRVGAHFAPRSLDDTDAVGLDRMGALAEGASATGTHLRVNEILEEELERVPSQSMRSTSREYLRVIQGGTMSMPRLSAEA